MAPIIAPGDLVAVFGYGLHGRAVATALVRRGARVRAADDRPDDAARAHAHDLGIDLIAAPEVSELGQLLEGSAALVPTPGLPDSHPVLATADALGVPVIGEFDLAGQWDCRPIVAITGTNGKTTVTTLVTEMLRASGIDAVDAGNVDVPLVTAIDSPEVEIFVVEASSFRLGHAQAIRPAVAAWLNFDVDHLDVHVSLDAYEAAKARIWKDMRPGGVAVANAADEVVMRNLPRETTVLTFGSPDAHARAVGGRLVLGDDPLLETTELRRSLPHDIENALAAATIAIAAGATRDAAAQVLRSFDGLAHRMELIGEADGVRWYDDSKATTPHAVLAGVGGFSSAVLVAGGRNKGVDLGALLPLAERLRAVVAIGEAAPELEAVFAGHVQTVVAGSMGDAVRAAAGLARSGDAVVLSPACTSYDWYTNYAARGDDFSQLVRELILGAPS